MGGFAYRAGRWDDAISLYRQGGDASRRAGDVNFGAFADCNVGEVLSDQGRLEAAEPLLRRALQVWRGTADDHGVAFATALLGRLHARAGRAEEASAALEDALARFRAMRVEIDAALAEALLAEAAAFAGRPEEARRRALRLRPALPPDARLEPLLDHVAGVASAQMGERAAALDRLAASLDAARSYQLPFEELLALDALVALDGSASSARRHERDRLLDQLDVVRVPAPPVSAVSGTADPPTRRGP
jgi:tetratricopeptide (TPR) repeat protein